MKIIDPGHVYDLQWLDGHPPLTSRSGIEDWNRLIFVKREGEGYPGNVGHHPGTTIQEVLRALIDRVKYVDGQISHPFNKGVIGQLRSAIHLLELRAAERHHRKLPEIDPITCQPPIEEMPVCPKCLHIGCEGDCHP